MQRQALIVRRNTKTTLILVNQMRESMDLYAPPSTPGGKAIKFAASLRVLLRRKVDKGDKDDLDGALGQEIQFIVEKNKVSNPYRRGFAYIRRGRPVDPVDDVIARGIERGIIRADTKFEDGELVSKKQWFTILQTDAMVKAIKEDLAAAERDKIDLPSSGGKPILSQDEPIVVYRKAELTKTLDFAPNLVEALREAILATLDDEASGLDSEMTPYDIALAARAKEFDEGAEDGLESSKIVETLVSSAVEAADGAMNDDLAEFNDK